MKQYHTIVVLLLLMAVQADAQIIDPKKKAKRAAENRANRRIDQGMNKGLDKMEEGVGSIFKKKNKKNKNADTSTEKAGEAGTASTASQNGTGAAGQSASFLDFVPGTKVLFSDNFEQDALMDFPANWNSTGSGKVVTIDNVQGRWLELEKNTYVNPVMNAALPENCTIEFDLYLMVQGKSITPTIEFGLTEVRDIVKQNVYYKEKFYTSIRHYAVGAKEIAYGTRLNVIANNKGFPFSGYFNKILRVSMSVNKERVRVYFDQTKIADLPRVVTTNLRNNFYLANTSSQSVMGMYAGNIRIASADVDARSLLVKQLMENGKAVTNDILFDVNSDRIKPESYSIIKQIGEAMQQTPSLKIKIVGHTDSDGGDAANLTLSKKRAAAVKSYITENYSVDDSRIQTDGKGESEPVTANSSSESKAKNRRVEFVKLKM